MTHPGVSYKLSWYNTRAVYRPLNRRFLRTTTGILSLTLQVNLLWLAGVHRHEPLGRFGARSMALRQANQHTQPVAEGSLVCTACQIIRHAAARPVTGALNPQPPTSGFVRLAPRSEEHTSELQS